MTTSKLADHVRSEANVHTSMHDISQEINVIDSSVDDDKLGHQPPNSIRYNGLIHMIMITINELFNVNKLKDRTKKQTESMLGLIQFYIYHFLLLFIYILITIYKKFQTIYRKFFIKFYTLIYHHNNSPQLIRDDVNKLNKLPKTLSCILDLKDKDDEMGGIDGLINQISELTAWTLSCGIPVLQIYEFNGKLITNKSLLTKLNYKISKNLAKYFGLNNLPNYSIKIPHENLIIFGPQNTSNSEIDLQIHLLSRIDGKPTIVELTKTMSELAINKELTIQDISIDLIDEELIELVGPEPDLLIYFGPNLDLQDFPPWHIRLTEIYWEPENYDVNYSILIRALQKYSNCVTNVGK
ncbi:Decaprenyl diphosphate synthase-like protein [Scheffersomyces coipomensis]|uniref:Decaprenyl diphosphate synthase-like protein n=1 Tax=Scheffersomyces coipomensis TaxID=1788519 RepID=UPI00315C6F17